MSEAGRAHIWNGGSILNGGSAVNGGSRLDYDILTGVAPSAVAVPIPMAGPLRPVIDGHPTNLGVPFQPILGATFPKRAWHPMLLADIIVGEFGETGWRQSLTLKGPPTDRAAILSEIDYLVARSAERPIRAAELLAQADDFTPYFADLLYSTPTSHPATWLLISASLSVGRLVAMFFKHEHNRPRPVQLYPALMPPLLTPPHPSYPNAHALQAGLMAETIGSAYPDMLEPLRALAERIGENREIAGVHFPSDRDASVSLLNDVMALLNKGKMFSDTLTAARAEWSNSKPS